MHFSGQRSPKQGARDGTKLFQSSKQRKRVFMHRFKQPSLISCLKIFNLNFRQNVKSFREFQKYFHDWAESGSRICFKLKCGTFLLILKSKPIFCRALRMIDFESSFLHQKILKNMQFWSSIRSTPKFLSNGLPLSRQKNSFREPHKILHF